MLRFIKRENADLKTLIKKVATTAGTAASRLEHYAKEDHSIILDDFRLPPGEDKTRKSIGAAKEKELLHHAGDTFEVILLLTQVEALNYASHLAKVGGENDFQSERARYLARLSAEMQSLHDEVVARLALRHVLPPLGH